MSKRNLTVKLVAYTDAAGKFSPEATAQGNEDNFYINFDLAEGQPNRYVPNEARTLSDLGMLLMVADGMGGMNAGEVASQIAVDTVTDFFAYGKITAEMAASHDRRKNYLVQTVLAADERIKKEAKHNPEHKGMGSTIIMAWIVGDELSLCWCGDSRAYRFNPRQGLQLISKDHSYVQELADEGIITYEETFDHPQGNIVTRSLGDHEQVAKPDTKLVQLFNEDIIMLCSDGLSGVLRDRKTYDGQGNLFPGDNLEDIIMAHHTNLQECREALWTAAENADWYDNVTAVLAQVTAGAESVVSQTQPPLDAAVPEPEVRTTAPVAMETGRQYSSVSKREKEPSGSGIKYGLLAAVITLAIVVLAWLLFGKGKKPKEPETTDADNHEIVIDEGNETESSTDLWNESPSGKQGLENIVDRVNANTTVRETDKPQKRVEDSQGSTQAPQKEQGSGQATSTPAATQQNAAVPTKPNTRPTPIPSDEKTGGSIGDQQSSRPSSQTLGGSESQEGKNQRGKTDNVEQN